jgi:hypothetical protein
MFYEDHEGNRKLEFWSNDHHLIDNAETNKRRMKVVAMTWQRKGGIPDVATQQVLSVEPGKIYQHIASHVVKMQLMFPGSTTYFFDRFKMVKNSRWENATKRAVLRCFTFHTHYTVYIRCDDPRWGQGRPISYDPERQAIEESRVALSITEIMNDIDGVPPFFHKHCVQSRCNKLSAVVTSRCRTDQKLHVLDKLVRLSVAGILMKLHFDEVLS